MSKKFLLFLIVVVFMFAGCSTIQPKKDYTGVFEQSATATQIWGRDNIDGTTKACDNILVGSITSGDMCFVGNLTRMKTYVLIANTTSGAAEYSPFVIAPDISPGNVRWLLVNNPPNGGRLVWGDSDDGDSVTALEFYDNKYITNQGSSQDNDLVLPANYDYDATRVAMIEEDGFDLTIHPDSGETLTLDGSLLTADYCVYSDENEGSKIAITRRKDASDAWIWDLTTIEGTWTNCGQSTHP